MTSVAQVVLSLGSRWQTDLCTFCAAIHHALWSRLSRCMSRIQISGSIFGRGDHSIERHKWNETFVEQKVTYAIELEGRFIIVENVPTRVCV